jgi:TRAP-type C4-dicarboxylate transport system substrate-binding protein
VPSLNKKKAASELVANEEANSYKIFEEAGGTVYRLSLEEKQAFKDASGNMRQWFVDNYGQEWLAVLESSAQACMVEP